MISFLRRFIDSKIGIAVMAILFGLIVLSFAGVDITGLGGVGRLASGGGDTVARIGGRTIGATELTDRVQTSFRQERAQNPQLTMAQYVAQGALDGIMNRMVGGLTMQAFAARQGVAISKRMVDAEIASIPGFQGAGGTFNDRAFQARLQQLGINEKDLRQDIENQKLARQLQLAATLGEVAPDGLVLPYASLLLETRQGRLLGIPSAALVAPGAPDEKAVAAYYARHTQDYLVPEQRTLRYAIIDGASFDKAGQPTDAEVADYYNKHKADYAARQTRSVEQLVVLTEAAARGIAADVAKGTSLDAAAKKAGLATSKLADQTEAMLARTDGAAAAHQIFAASANALVGPVKTPLGWTLAKVTAVTNIAAKSLDQARPAIVTLLGTDKSRRLFADYMGKLDDQTQEGTSFDDIVKARGLTVVTTPLLMKDGKSAANPAFVADADVKAILPAGFDADPQGDPVLAQIVQDKRFALVDVGEVVAAAPAPLAKVHDAVVNGYKLDVAAAKAKAMAYAIQAKVNGGKDLAAAGAETGLKLPPIETIGDQRANAMRQQNITPPLAMLFSMPLGSTKVLQLRGNNGWVVIHLDKIVRSDAARSDPDMVKSMRGELQKVIGIEHADQLEKAIEKEMKLKTYPDQIARTKAELMRSGSGG